MADKDISSGAVLLKFCLLAKSAKGKGCAAVIQQALSSPNTFVFGELLDQPNVKALATDENKKWYDTLALFAYGTHSDYRAKPQNYGELSPPLVKKLKQLSVVSIASAQKSIPYALLLEQLELANVRELEDLIIDCMYAGVVRGKLDQKAQRFQVDWTMGRDIRPGQLPEMIKILSLWCERSETLMKEIQEKVQYANFLHEQHQKESKEFEDRVEEIKSNLKAAMEGEMGGAEFDVGDLAAFDGANKKGKGKKGAGGPHHMERHRRR